MKSVERIFLSFFTVGFISWSNELSINFSNSDIEGGSPGPPNLEHAVETALDNKVADENHPKQLDICYFDDGLENVENDLIEFRLVHSLFRSEEIVAGIKYQGKVWGHFRVSGMVCKKSYSNIFMYRYILLTHSKEGIFSY